MIFDMTRQIELYVLMRLTCPSVIATRTRASKKLHMTTREFVFSLMALWMRSRTDMYSCSCFTPEKEG